MAEQTLTVTFPVSQVALMKDAIENFRQLLDDCVLDELIEGNAELSMDLIRGATEERVNRLMAVVEIDTKLGVLLSGVRG